MHPTTTCLYCEVEVPGRPVPGAWDDYEWEKEATEHLADCEWVLTRAHTRPHPDDLTAGEE
jgi:hypothetical protein